MGFVKLENGMIYTYVMVLEGGFRCISSYERGENKLCHGPLMELVMRIEEVNDVVAFERIVTFVALRGTLDLCHRWRFGLQGQM